MVQPRFALLLLLALTTAVSAQAPTPGSLSDAELTRRIDAFVTVYMQVNDFSGTVLLARDGKPLFLESYGSANREWQIPNARDTKFRIGSITKSFTSMLIMQLREQAKLKVDDSICLYIARCPDAWKAVTLHHLLTHTSGIVSHTRSPAWQARNMVPHAIYYNQPVKLPVARPVATVDPALYDRYAGQYQLPSGVLLTISNEGSKLFAEAPGPGKFELSPESDTRFFSDTPEATITFTVANGTASQLVLTLGGRDRIAKRLQ